jgi:hypothetical protein
LFLNYKWSCLNYLGMSKLVKNKTHVLLHRDKRTRQNALCVFLKFCSHTATTVYFANNYFGDVQKPS